MDPEKAKANFSRVCALLVDKGRDALKAALHMVHPPSTLAAVLNANKSTLKKTRNSVINASQWNLLFPVSGIPDSNNFDITLLTILLRNICGLASPAAGSDNRPPVSDTSISGNILRIKIFRNEVYAHIANAQYDDTAFETLWQEITKPLVKLGIPQQYIDELKTARVSFEEECHIETLKEWTELEDKLFSKFEDVERKVNSKSKVSVVQKTCENENPSQVNQLAKFDFTRKIEDLSKKFHSGTRHWYFEQVSSWFSKEKSTVMIITADAGVGIVLSAKFCKLYEQCGQLAAYHFSDFRNEDYSNPKRILQSLASQMCDNVDGFRDKLTEVLRREHSQDSLSDAFRVLLNVPLHALDRREPMLIVVDALYESKTDVKNEFLEMLFDEFLELPKWVKVLVWSKTEFNARKKLLHLSAEILPRICLLNAVNKCSHDADDEVKRSHHFDQECSRAGNRNLDNDFALDSQPNSISEEAFQLDLEHKKATALLPNFEINVKNLETKNAKGNEKCSRLVNVSSQTSVNPTGKFEDSLVQHPLKPKAKLKRDPGNNSTTQMQDWVSSNEDFSIGEVLNKDKSNKKPERKLYKDSSMIDLPQLNQAKQGKGIDGYVKYSGDETRMKSEKMLKSFENEDSALKSRSSILFPESPAPMLSLRVKELEEENAFLRNDMRSLQAKYEDTLAELGRMAVQKTAKENEERKSELFQQIFRSSLSKGTVLSTSKDRAINDMNGFPNRFLKLQTTNERADTQEVIYPATSVEQHVEEAGALVQRSNRQPGKEEMVTSGENPRRDRRGTEVSTFWNNNENQAPPTQNSSSNNTSREKTNGGEGINQSENVQGASGLASSSRQSYENLSLSVQQDSGTEYISLGNVPPTSVATTLYNNYKLLLLSLAKRLLSSDVVKLKNWGSQNFSINDPQNTTDVLFQLDQKGIINASDLSQLCHFFESIVRYDLVYIIDAFLLGDYSLLRQNLGPKQQAANAAQTSQSRSTTMYHSLFNAMNTGRQSLVNPAVSGILQTSPGRNATTLRKPGIDNAAQRSHPQRTQLAAVRNLSDTTNPVRFPRFPNENQSTASEQQNLKPAGTGFTPTRMADVVVADGSSVTNERRAMAGNYLTTTNPSVTNNPRNAQAVGSNGSKHSKFQRPETERSNISNSQSPSGSRNRYLDREDNWLCSHYKRHCYVKFECCNNFWPCHRCHNNQSSCGRKKLKSRDTKMLKCVYCNKVQQFGHSCCDCGAKFSDYYCGLCKHLTGIDDNPYHCEKCGICRIHGDRSFHCDVCGVCLDVQLRGNHKCREGSAHDECCICLEDAFTGCQILPCSHKVHKECATQMIRSGITRCPICRESFAHKLERRPLPNSRKRAGK